MAGPVEPVKFDGFPDTYSHKNNKENTTYGKSCGIQQGAYF